MDELKPIAKLHNFDKEWDSMLELKTTDAAAYAATSAADAASYAATSAADAARAADAADAYWNKVNPIALIKKLIEC